MSTYSLAVILAGITEIFRVISTGILERTQWISCRPENIDPRFFRLWRHGSDCNFDGFPELIVANHTNVGNHRSRTSVHWGSPEGFSGERRTALSATGVHFFSLCDIGNVYDRSDFYDYLSPAFDAGEVVRIQLISWQAETPFRTRVALQVRTAKTKAELTSAPGVALLVRTAVSTPLTHRYPTL